MIELLDRPTLNGTAIIRSLFLWQQILGADSDAAQRLRKATGPLVRLPLGADVSPHLVPIAPNLNGFDIHEAALPGADAVFAYVTAEGLRLAASADPTADGRGLRHLQVIDAAGKPHRRQGTERVMLRYRLPPEALGVRQLMFVAITQDAAPATRLRPKLHAWVELEREGVRTLVLPVDTRTAALTPDEAVQMTSFPPGALLAHNVPNAAAFLVLELIGDPVDVKLRGEALVVGA